MELWEGPAAGATCERGFPERRRLRSVKERRRHNRGGDAAAAAAETEEAEKATEVEEEAE